MLVSFLNWLGSVPVGATRHRTGSVVQRCHVSATWDLADSRSFPNTPAQGSAEGIIQEKEV